MIYTLTMNPAIDMNITTKGLKRGLVNRTFDTVYTPNGKGVNVTLTIKHFGEESVVTGFFGGFSGNYVVTELEKSRSESSANMGGRYNSNQYFSK